MVYHAGANDIQTSPGGQVQLWADQTFRTKYSVYKLSNGRIFQVTTAVCEQHLTSGIVGYFVSPEIHPHAKYPGYNYCIPLGYWVEAQQMKCYHLLELFLLEK